MSSNPWSCPHPCRAEASSWAPPPVSLSLAEPTRQHLNITQVSCLFPETQPHLTQPTWHTDPWVWVHLELRARRAGGSQLGSPQATLSFLSAGWSWYLKVACSPFKDRIGHQLLMGVVRKLRQRKHPTSPSSASRRACHRSGLCAPCLYHHPSALAATVMPECPSPPLPLLMSVSSVGHT